MHVGRNLGILSIGGRNKVGEKHISRNQTHHGNISVQKRPQVCTKKYSKKRGKKGGKLIEGRKGHNSVLLFYL